MPSLDNIPDAKVKHTDWEVAVVADLTAAAGYAGGGWLFSFRNGSYNSVDWSGLIYDMAFLGAGGGLGLKPGLGKIPGTLWGSTHRKWHKISCDRPFSAYDLGGGLGSLGRVTCLVPGVYRFLYITATNTDGDMFHSQTINGLSFGALGAVLVGTWQYVC